MGNYVVPACTNAGDKFVNGVKANETGWAAVVGEKLFPIFLPKNATKTSSKMSQCRIPGQGVQATGNNLSIHLKTCVMTYM